MKNREKEINYLIYLKSELIKQTKKEIKELCVPFRDKYNLTNKQTLCIARDELSKQELLEILDKGE